jgi:hypothetical protein
MRKAKRKNAQTNRSDTRAKFRDLELHRWRFFLRPEETTSGADASALPDGFVDALNDAGAWLGWSEGALLRPDLHAAPADFSQRLVVAPAAEWREHNGMLRTLEARTLLDACYLQLGAAKKGALQTPHALQNALPALPAGEGYLGDAECWCLMRTDGEPDEHALRAAIQRLALPPDGYLAFDTQGGLLALYPDALIACIVYPPAQTQPMSQLLHHILPPFLLNLLKIRRLREQYLQFKPQVQGEEEQLERLMARARQAHRLSIEQIEGQSVQLAQQQAHYLEALSKIEEWLHTLKTLQDNLRRLLRDPLWLDGEASEPARRMLEPIQLRIDQMQSDLHYFHITRQQADLHLESLNTASVTRNTQWNRRIATVLLVLAFPTLLGAGAEFFPEITKWPVLLRVVVAGVVCLVVGVLLARSFNPSRLSLGSNQRTSPNTPTEPLRAQLTLPPTRLPNYASAEPPKGCQEAAFRRQESPDT